MERITGEGEGTDKVRELAVGLLVDLHVWRSVQSAEEHVRGIVENLGIAPELGRTIVFRLKEPLVYEDETNAGRAAGVRSRAAALLAAVVDNTAPALKALIDSAADDPDAIQLGQSLVGVADGVALHLSGLLAPDRRRNRPGVPESIRRELYSRLATILDALESVAVPRVAHYLVELLAASVDFDRRGVLLRVRSVVRSSALFGYQAEALAVDRVVHLVETYLAEHRDLFREDGECREALVQILDAFVKAGWPQAREVAYRLNEALR